MNSSPRDYNYYLEEYVNKERAPADISKDWENSYPNLIRRELKRLGFPPRSKSDAQKLALKSGRHKHPTKGTHRSDSTKLQISEQMAKRWEEVSDEERARRVDLSKKQWEALSEDDRLIFRKNAAEAVRRAGKEGSKLEKYLMNELTKLGFTVIYHSDDLIPNEKLQTDLYLPNEKIILEVDGPSHFYNIWGEDALAKTQEADNRKNFTLISFGFAVIRVKHLSKSMSAVNNRTLLQTVLEKIEEVKKEFPKLEDRIIEIQEGQFRNGEETG